MSAHIGDPEVAGRIGTLHLGHERHLLGAEEGRGRGRMHLGLRPLGLPAAGRVPHGRYLLQAE